MGLIGIAYTIRDRKRDRNGAALAEGRQGTELVDCSSQNEALPPVYADDVASVPSRRSTASAFSTIIRRREVSRSGAPSSQGRTLLQRLSRPVESA